MIRRYVRLFLLILLLLEPPIGIQAEPEGSRVTARETIRLRPGVFLPASSCNRSRSRPTVRCRFRAGNFAERARL